MFALSEEQHREVERIFSMARITPEKRDRCELLTEQTRILALFLLGMCPPSRELDQAVARLEEALMWAKAAVLHDGGE